MDNSPLARLPRELRNYIYTLTIPTCPHPSRRHPNESCLEHDLELHNLDYEQSPGIILQVCRQMRREARLLVWASVEGVSVYLGSNLYGTRKKVEILPRILPDVFGWDVLKVIKDGKITVWWEEYCSGDESRIDYYGN